MAGVLGVSAATAGLAAAEEALVEGAGAEFADGGELGVELVEAELQCGGIEGGWHGASFLSVHNTERNIGATNLQHKGIREPTGQISESCRTPVLTEVDANAAEKRETRDRVPASIERAAPHPETLPSRPETLLGARTC